jgi:hypothetical protein
MIEGGLSFHKEGKGLGLEGGKRGQVLSLGGFSLGNNILILFQKGMRISCFILSS